MSKLYLCPASLGEYRWTGVWGALALVVDRSPPLSKHIQLYDVHTWTRLLNVQLYHSMIYLEPNHLFHTFEIEVRSADCAHGVRARTGQGERCGRPR